MQLLDKRLPRGSTALHRLYLDSLGRRIDALTEFVRICELKHSLDMHMDSITSPDVHDGEDDAFDKI